MKELTSNRISIAKRALCAALVVIIGFSVIFTQPMSVGTANESEEVYPIAISLYDGDGNLQAASSTALNGVDDDEYVLCYNGLYINGDYIIVQAPQYPNFLRKIGERDTERKDSTFHMWIKLSDKMDWVLVNGLDGEVKFPIPLGNSAFPADAFIGNSHVIKAKFATDEEIHSYRNVALNPYAQRIDSDFFPQAIASSVNPTKDFCEPRNVIDGKVDSTVWSGTNKPETEISILFGRTIKVSSVVLTLAAANRFSGAVLEFSDSTEVIVSLTDTNEPQTISFPERVSSWVRLKSFTGGLGSYVAISEFEVYGNEVDLDEAPLLTRDQYVNLATKIEDHYLERNVGMGDNFWQNAVSINGHMSAYYLTGDQNYMDVLTRWADKYNFSSRSYSTDPDTYLCASTYLDLVFLDPAFAEQFDRFLLPHLSDTVVNSGSTGHFFWNDLIYMGLQVFVKMYLYTGETKYLDRMNYFYWNLKSPVAISGANPTLDSDGRRRRDTLIGLYDVETGLWWRDHKYIDPDVAATMYGLPARGEVGGGQEIGGGSVIFTGDRGRSELRPAGYGGSPTGNAGTLRRNYWARGMTWTIAGLAKILQDLPDVVMYQGKDFRQEYEQMFLTVARGLVEAQQEDGLWRQNLSDPLHVRKPEASSAMYYLYGLAWGINSGILPKDEFLPPLLKAFHGANTHIIHPDGFIGRVQRADEQANPDLDFGYNITENYVYGMAVHALGEFAKISGGVDGDFQPALDRRMQSAVAVQVGSSYAVDGINIVPLVDANRSLKAEKVGNNVYLPVQFFAEKYNINVNNARDIDYIEIGNVKYAEIKSAIRVLSPTITGERQIFNQDDLYVISYKKKLFRAETEQKMIDRLKLGLENGEYPPRPTRAAPRFNYGDNDPVKRTNSIGFPDESGVYHLNGANNIIDLTQRGASNITTVELDATFLNAKGTGEMLFAVGSNEQDSRDISKYPICLRTAANFSNWDAWNGKSDGMLSGRYQRSRLQAEKNVKYRLKIVIRHAEQTFDAYVTDPYGEVHTIANNFQYRASASDDNRTKPIGMLLLGGTAGIVENIKANGETAVNLPMAPPNPLPVAPTLSNPTLAISFDSLPAGGITAAELTSAGVAVQYNNWNPVICAAEIVSPSGAENYFRIMGKDADPSARFTLPTKTSGISTIAFSFMPDPSYQDANVTIGGSARAFTIIKRPAGLTVREASGDIPVAVNEANKWYNIVVEIDISNNKVSLWIDGVYIASRRSDTHQFYTRDGNITSINYLAVSGGSSAAGYGSIKNIRVA